MFCICICLGYLLKKASELLLVNHVIQAQKLVTVYKSNQLLILAELKIVGITTNVTCMFGVLETNKYSLFSKYSEFVQYLLLIKVNNIFVFLPGIEFIIMLLISLGPTLFQTFFSQYEFRPYGHIQVCTSTH